MTKTLYDLANSQEETSFLFALEKQFPSIYREEGRELIELLSAYYKFLETQTNQTIYNNRRLKTYRDIDSTLDRMLIFFKNKYLNGLTNSVDTRFVIKHILDLYRRKGTKEGIQLFFRLFFDSEVDIYYPSVDMFKPSSSFWKEGLFLQMYFTEDQTIFSDLINRKIFGSESNASAYVDDILFVNINGSSTPILVISGMKGKFRGFDRIYAKEPDKEYGIVYGSLNTIAVSNNSTSDNIIGDIVEITSAFGYGGKGRVSKITKNLTGEIKFGIQDGSYGYSLQNTQLITSNQVLIFNNSQLHLIPGERIQQTNSFGHTVIGLVIGQNTNVVGIRLESSGFLGDLSEYIFEVAAPIQTINRIVPYIFTADFTSIPNDTSSLSIGSIENTETVSIITDTISNYLNVNISSGNYSLLPPALVEMSGTTANGIIPNLSTVISDAFVPQAFTIGSINSLSGINPGSDYFNDVFVLSKDNVIGGLNIRDQILTFDVLSGVVLFEGDILEQTRDVENFYGVLEQKNIRCVIKKIVGQSVTVKLLTLNNFSAQSPVYKVGSSTPIIISNISIDTNSPPMGMNAEIFGSAEYVFGKIVEIEITNSGVGFQDFETVNIYNRSKAERQNVELSLDATGVCRSRSVGITDGRWVSFDSHINQEKVIQDSFYYQDYSYDLTTDVDFNAHRDVYENFMHPSGTKSFWSFARNSVINIDVSIKDFSFSIITSFDLIED